MISKGELELLDDVLCGVDANPRRVKMARDIARKVGDEIKTRRSFVQAIANDMETIRKEVAIAGMYFLCDAEIDGHKELHEIIARLAAIERDAKTLCMTKSIL